MLAGSFCEECYLARANHTFARTPPCSFPSVCFWKNQVLIKNLFAICLSNGALATGVHSIRLPYSEYGRAHQRPLSIFGIRMRPSTSACHIGHTDAPINVRLPYSAYGRAHQHPLSILGIRTCPSTSACHIRNTDSPNTSTRRCE